MEQQLGTGIGIIVGLLILAVFGGIVGWIASLLIKGTGLGLAKDIILGILGSIVGGWLFQALGLSIGGGVIGAFVPALVGAVLVLLVVKAIRRRGLTMSRGVLLPAFFLLSLVPALGVGSPEREAPSAAASGSGEIEQPSVESVLVGPAWQLVAVVSMDDRVDAPDDRSLYTLTFNADGSVQIRADCNRGTGSWTSSVPGQLQFGDIAGTQALCLPGSLHDRFMAQFPWVRSYVIKDGHLFLATMADGSIIEFEPVESALAATVLGEEIRTGDPGEMQEIVLTRLFDRYAEQQGIEVTDTEIDTFVENMRRGMEAEGLNADDGLTPEEAAEVETMRREMARSIIRQWKLDRALYKQYGGRIIFQQFGPEPLDAYRQFVEERQKAGDFEIEEPSFEAEFWRYFTDDSMHTFFEKGSEEETMAFEVPPWEQLGAAD